MSYSPERILCSDGNCIETINEKGYCSICGRPLDGKQNSEQDFLKGMQEVEVRKQEGRKDITNSADITVGKVIEPNDFAFRLLQLRNQGSGKRVIEAENDFGFRLLLQLAKQSSDKNVFISPFSVAIALAMTYNGAEDTTKKAMAATLGLTGLSLQDINATNRVLVSMQKEFDPEIQLAIANSIWIRKGISMFPDFIQRISNDYGGKIVNLDFSASDATDTINRWVAEKTNEKIKALVTQGILKPLAILIFINAIYFKGIWARQFEQARTANRPFTLPDGTRKECPMMMQWGIYKYYEHSNFQAISLPYGDRQLSMYIFLPKRFYLMRKFQTNLNTRNWQNWITEFRMRRGQIVLPRFKLEYGAGLKDALVALGMGTAFEAGAHFQGMGTGPFWISDLIHRSFVEVNEKGTEAAAATGTRVLKGSLEALQEKEFTMIVDHPFVATICDNNSGAVLFAGFILDPT